MWKQLSMQLSEKRELGNSVQAVIMRLSNSYGCRITRIMFRLVPTNFHVYTTSRAILYIETNKQKET